jgi:hypothetical protein
MPAVSAQEPSDNRPFNWCWRMFMREVQERRCVRLELIQGNLSRLQAKKESLEDRTEVFVQMQLRSVQMNQSFLRRRTAAPTAMSPDNIRAYVEGSGTAVRKPRISPDP